MAPRARLAQPRLNALLLGVFACATVALTALGLFSVMTTMVRLRELGIRVALGATAKDLLQLVIRRGLAIAAAGVLAGLAGALLANHLLAATLYEVNPLDLVTLTFVALSLLAVATLAIMIPVRSSTRIDPVVALRIEL